MDYFFTLQDLSEGQKGAGQQLGCCWRTGQMVGDKPGIRKWIETLSYGQSRPGCKQLPSFNVRAVDEMRCNNANNTQRERTKVCNRQHQ